MANGVYCFGVSAFRWQLGASLTLSLINLLAVLRSAFLFGSLFKTSTYAVPVVAVLFLIGFSILQAWITDLVKIEPWFLISYASGILGTSSRLPIRPGGDRPRLDHLCHAHGHNPHPNRDRRTADNGGILLHNHGSGAVSLRT